MAEPTGVSPVIGIWDTGATNSVISEQLAKSMGLTPVGSVNIQHAGGTEARSRYLVDIWLPNKVVVQGLLVSDCAALAGADVLIGMDVIAAGDFAVTTVNGNTVHSFRIPSVETIDYVTTPRVGTRIAPAVHAQPHLHQGTGRNQPCPCGSGRKHKNCCLGKPAA